VSEVVAGVVEPPVEEEAPVGVGEAVGFASLLHPVVRITATPARRKRKICGVFIFSFVQK
jgi:hypothetical protein